MLPAQLTDVGIFGSIERFGDLSIHAVIDLRRAFSRAELEIAMRAAVAAFPVLGCRYEPRFFRDHWIPADGPHSDAVHVVDAPVDLEAETMAWAQRRLDPTRDRPLRVVSLHREGGSRLILSLLHLAVDGGGVAAVGHVFGAALYGVPPSLPVDERRDLRSTLERLRFYHLPVLARDMAASLLLPLRVLLSGKRERPYPQLPSAAPSVRQMVISVGEVLALKARFSAQKASINDLLIAALAKVSAGRSDRGDVVVLYTMDLRRYAASARLAAANISTIVTTLVPRASIGDLASTAGAVAAITRRHRESLVGPAFVLTPVALTGSTPHALVRWMMKGIHPIAVDLPISRGMVLTNVGRVDEGLGAFGDDIEGIQIIGPIIESVPVPAVVAFGFRGELHLELYASTGVAPEALVELEGEIRAALELPPAS
ncbi:MAG: hypothetical protein ABI193_23155 [Minicystis sp.]